MIILSRMETMEVPQNPPSIAMPGIYIREPMWISPGRGANVFRPHKPLPRKRDLADSPSDLRALYQSSANGARSSNGRHDESTSSLLNSPTTPVLPPTPPTAHNENSDFSHDESSVADTTILRSRVVTPILRNSPPTPDQTPPRNAQEVTLRPWLGTRPSMTSTRAESFRTAREEFQSDDGSEDSAPRWTHTHTKRQQSNNDLPISESFQPHSSPLAQSSKRNTPTKLQEVVTQPRNDKWESSTLPAAQPHVNGNFGIGETPKSVAATESENGDQHERKRAVESVEQTPRETPITSTKSNKVIGPSPSFRSRLPRYASGDLEQPDTGDNVELVPRRGTSLRDRLEESRQLRASDSTEQFASDIGWSGADDNLEKPGARKSWHHSVVSTPSTIEAMVFDKEPKRQMTLRHRTKAASLRVASSPLPSSNRSSLQSNNDSPHRLSHKNARLNNQNRLSYGSDASRSLSMSSAAATPAKAEVIRVAVIPERASSLHSFNESHKRNSASLSTSSSGRSRFPSLHNTKHHHRTSTSSSIEACKICGKNRRLPPPIPLRASSLSAPTSRNASRANSITSEHLRVHRMAAERDLRKTLDRMESERMAPILSTQKSEAETATSYTPSPPEPGSEKWASQRPTSILDTPFSQSVSVGSIEMGEARAVNLFPHNNNSLQLIEKHSLQESRAVQELRNNNFIQGLEAYADGPITPRGPSSVPAVDSPLRYPRKPPIPPNAKVIPPTTGVLTTPKSKNGTTSQGQSVKRYSSLRRPSLGVHRRSGSFVKSMTRNLTLKNPRNKKTDEDLDGTMYPFWRPQGFWDGINDSDSDNYKSDEGEVRNSLGMPQKQTIINGPLSLVRHLSDSSRRRKASRGIIKKASFGSLSRLRASRSLYSVPGMRGVHFRFVGIRDMQEWILLAKNRKEDERREKRRRELRESIGANVISQGDSRFPVGMRLPSQVLKG